MKKKPTNIDTRLVSIITPTYNSEKYIEETIASIKAQTHSHWEHLIVDDGSTDGTVALVRRLAEEDARIKFLQLEENSGSAIARNIGIKEATGTYMTFIDSDDIWFPDFIEIASKK